MELKKINFIVEEQWVGCRLDRVLASLFTEFSRARLQEALKRQEILLNDHGVKASERLKYGDHVHGVIHQEKQLADQAQAMNLNIIHADDDIIVLNKPAGLVVHPAAGNPDGTLLNALLHDFPETALLPRAGIVHRLDKDTSGAMVVARTLAAQHHLQLQLKNHSMGREYLALVYGVFSGGGTINAPIGRHSRDRKKMAVRDGGREAITHYFIEERFENLTLLRVQLETGRTHQIRVHLANALHPLVGDPVYGGRGRLPAGISTELRAMLMNFQRQALHAANLRLRHPRDDRELLFHATMPDDFSQLLKALRKESSSNHASEDI